MDFAVTGCASTNQKELHRAENGHSNSSGSSSSGSSSGNGTSSNNSSGNGNSSNSSSGNGSCYSHNNSQDDGLRLLYNPHLSTATEEIDLLVIVGNYCFDSLPVRLLACGGGGGGGGGGVGVADTMNTGTTTNTAATTTAANANVNVNENVYEIGVTPRQYKTTSTHSPTSPTTSRHHNSTRTTTRMPEDFVARRVDPSQIFQSNVARSSLCSVEDELFNTVATTLCQQNRSGAPPLSNIPL